LVYISPKSHKNYQVIILFIEIYFLFHDKFLFKRQMLLIKKIVFVKIKMYKYIKKVVFD